MSHVGSALLKSLWLDEHPLQKEIQEKPKLYVFLDD